MRCSRQRENCGKWALRYAIKYFSSGECDLKFRSSYLKTCVYPGNLFDHSPLIADLIHQSQIFITCWNLRLRNNNRLPNRGRFFMLGDQSWNGTQNQHARWCLYDPLNNGDICCRRSWYGYSLAFLFVHSSIKISSVPGDIVLSNVTGTHLKIAFPLFVCLVLSAHDCPVTVSTNMNIFSVEATTWNRPIAFVPSAAKTKL